MLAAAATAVCLFHTGSFRRRGSHGIAVTELQGFRFVTATNGASAFVCVLCGRAILNTTRDNFSPYFL